MRAPPTLLARRLPTAAVAAAAPGIGRIRVTVRLRPPSTGLLDAAAGFCGIGRTRHGYSSSLWALRLVYSLQFGAALCAGRVSSCEIVQQPPLQLFAATEIAAERPVSLLSRCENFSRSVCVGGHLRTISRWMKKAPPSDRSG